MRRWLTLLFGAALFLGGFPSAGSSEESQLKGRLLCSRLTDDTWQIWEINLTTGNRKQTTFSPGDKRYPVWLPDGQVLYHAPPHACYRAQGDTPGVPVLKEFWPVSDVAWSPDGSRVVFSKYETGVVDLANLWVSDAQGKGPEIITHEAGLQNNAAWSPDGSRIAYAHSHGYKSADIYLLNADGSGRVRLTDNEARDFLPAWSPNGKKIAFTSDRSGDYEIWIMNAGGSEPKQLTDSPGLDTRPAWSPDGEKIAFTTSRSGVLEIWVMNADGTNQQLLEHAEGGACDPAWF